MRHFFTGFEFSKCKKNCLLIKHDLPNLKIDKVVLRKKYDDVYRIQHWTIIQKSEEKLETYKKWPIRTYSYPNFIISCPILTILHSIIIPRKKIIKKKLALILKTF